MGKRLDIKPGDRFSRLTIIKEAKKKNKKRQFLCKCDCGNVKIVELSRLRSAITKSCGCLHSEITANRNFHHGLYGTRIYKIWEHMIDRCQNPNNSHYKYYGGRGIKVCDEWFKIKNFYSWAIKNGYKNNLTIERKDVNGDYSPDNCKWATSKEQANNRTNNHYLAFQGEIHTCAEWADKLGIDSGTIRRRLAKGWTIEDTLTKPTRENRLLTFNGKTQNVAEWARETGINKKTIAKRLRMGWGLEKTLTTSVKIEYRRLKNEA